MAIPLKNPVINWWCMKTKKLIGIFLISTPFIGLFIWASIIKSVLFALAVYAAVALLFAVVTIGVDMMLD